MSDTAGAIVLSLLLLFFAGPVFVAMTVEAIGAAVEMWRDLFANKKDRS